MHQFPRYSQFFCRPDIREILCPKVELFLYLFLLSVQFSDHNVFCILKYTKWHYLQNNIDWLVIWLIDYSLTSSVTIQKYCGWTNCTGMVRRFNRSRTDNTMAKRKRTKGQTTIYKILHRKLKIEQHEPIKNQGWTHVLRKGKKLLLH